MLLTTLFLTETILLTLVIIIWFKVKALHNFHYSADFNKQMYALTAIHVKNHIKKYEKENSKHLLSQEQLNQIINKRLGSAKKE